MTDLAACLECRQWSDTDCLAGRREHWPNGAPACPAFDPRVDDERRSFAEPGMACLADGRRLRIPA